MYNFAHFSIVLLLNHNKIKNKHVNIPKCMIVQVRTYRDNGIKHSSSAYNRVRVFSTLSISLPAKLEAVP